MRIEIFCVDNVRKKGGDGDFIHEYETFVLFFDKTLKKRNRKIGKLKRKKKILMCILWSIVRHDDAVTNTVCFTVSQRYIYILVYTFFVLILYRYVTSFKT